MMKKLFMVLAILALLAGPVWATAWTEDATKFGIVNAVPADTTTSYTCSKKGIYLTDIEFVPTQAGDVMVVRTGSTSGPIIAYFKSIDGGPQHLPFDGYVAFSPVILYSDNTLGGTANTAKVIIRYGNQP